MDFTNCVEKQGAGDSGRCPTHLKVKFLYGTIAISPQTQVFDITQNKSTQEQRMFCWLSLCEDFCERSKEAEE